MLVLPTAKVLLYIALQLGPAQPQAVYATSNSESYLWEMTPKGWTLEAKGFPASDFTRDPDQTVDFNEFRAPTDPIPHRFRTLSRYSWKHDSAIVFDNGDRIEKHGDHAFLILNAGGANEKVFTILYPSVAK